MTTNNLENYITNINNLIRQNNSNMNLLINTMANNQVIINNYLSLIHREQLFNGINIPESNSNSSQNNNINNVNVENNQNQESINNQPPSLNRNIRYNVGINNDNTSYISYAYDVTNRENNTQLSPIESLLRLFSQSYQVPRTNRDASNNINQVRIINNEEISDDVLNNYHIICFDNYGDIENPLNDICPITRERFYQNCRVYQIRGCRHIYNPGALQRWIDLNHTICPYCRHNILDNIENDNTSISDNDDNDDNDENNSDDDIIF